MFVLLYHSIGFALSRRTAIDFDTLKYTHTQAHTRMHTYTHRHTHNEHAHFPTLSSCSCFSSILLLFRHLCICFYSLNTIFQQDGFPFARPLSLTLV